MAVTTIDLNFAAITGKTLYIKIENSTGSIWNGTAMVSYVLANLATYATAFPESPSGSGRFSLNFLALALPADTYSWVICIQSGGSPSITDAVAGSGSDYWSGSAFGQTAVATLPSPAPLGYGPIGTGSVAVNQDYPTTGNLTVQANGQAIVGAQIRMYLASEYNANPNTATIRGQTLSVAGGAWANAIDVDAGSYIVTFDAAGYQTFVKTLTVS